MSSFAPIFVVGVGRSGTSLVQSMLASHSQLAFPPETQFVRRYVGRKGLTRAYARGGVDAVREVLDADDRIGRVDLDIGRVLARYTDGVPFSEADLYEALLTAYAETRSKLRVGDKDPRCIEFLPLLARHWPAAQVVHVLRDPRDVLASKKKAAWSRHRSALTHVFANRVQFRAGRRNGRRLYGPRYHEVVYEALLADPEAALRDLIGRLGLPYEEGMLQFAVAAESLVAADELAWKRDTLGPLLSANSGKWRRELSTWEAELAELACSEALRTAAAGHEAGRELTRGVRFLARCVAFVMRVAEWPYRAYRYCTLFLRVGG